MAQTLPTSEKKEKEVLTILDKTAAPVLLAFLSGNTVNLFMQIGGSDFANVKFFGLAIAHYCGGMGLYKFLDLQLQGLKCTTAAKVVFGLHAASDQLRITFPESRFTLLPLSISGGFFNALSGGKLGGVMAMQHGQFQSLMFAIVTAWHKGPNKELTAAILKPLRVIVAFCIGLMMGAYSSNMSHPLSGNRRFSFVGALYAAILVLHEVPRS